MLTCQTTGAWSAAASTCAETCATSPCQNSGTCTDAGGTGHFQCRCPAPVAWEGDRCETDIDECLTNDGGCDTDQGSVLSHCSNRDGSYQCDACDASAFQATLPQDPSGAADVACCHAPSPGDHLLPCDASAGACEPATGLTAGCIGPADATKSQPSLSQSGLAQWTEQVTAEAGRPISLSVVTHDIHDRISTLPRAPGASGGSSTVSTELSLTIHGPHHDLCSSGGHNVCSQGYCSNGGACTPGRDLTPTCTCPPGTSGTQCDVLVDPCANGPCGTGECVPGVGDFCCICPEGLGGEDCSIPTSTICNGTIVEETCCSGNTCAGSRDVVHFCSKECAAVALVFVHDCAGTTDRDTYLRVVETLYGVCNSTECSHDDPCSSAPCTNGGTCRNTGFGGYQCVCDSSWYGENCESQVPDCLSSQMFAFDSERHLYHLPETTDAGDYTFSVRLRDAELERSSLLTLQTYPSALNASESTVDLGYNLSEAGRVNSFWVTPRDSWSNVRDPIKFAQFERSMGTDSVSVDVRVEDQPVQAASPTNCTWESRAEAFLCAWVANRAGAYSISVSVPNSLLPQAIAGIEVLNGASLSIVPGPFNDTKTVVDAPPSTIVAGIPVLVNLTAFDSYNNVRYDNDTLVAVVQPNASTNVSWTFSGEGYVVSFAANISVEYLLGISLGGLPVLGSPYTVGVRQADVSLHNSEIVGCLTGCLTMPDTKKSVDVIVRDQYDNVRDDLDVVVIEVSSSCTTSSCETTSVEWNEPRQVYNVSFTMHSPTEHSHSIAILINTELLATMDYHYAFHSNLNASTCTTADCAHAMEASQFVDGWDGRDICHTVGCLYQAAVLESVTYFIDDATTALYAVESLRPVLVITPTCQAGRSSPFYWKDASYCTTSSTGTNSQQVYRQDGQNFFIDFNIERPGLYTLSLSLQHSSDGTVWSGLAVDIEVQPGPPSTEQTTLTYQTSGTGTPLAGVQYEFDLQVMDANSNSRFGLEEVFVDLRLAPSANLNDLSQEVQPTITYVRTAATPRIELGADSPDEIISPGSTRADHSFNFTIDTQGVFELSVWVCSGDRLDLCNTTETPIALANPLQFTVCQTDSVIEFFTDPRGFVDGARLHECVCDTGFFGDNGGFPNGCHACDGGFYSNQLGSPACTECAAGYSCDCNSIDSKIPCGAGSEAACSQCQACGIGRYQDEEGQITCNECPEGFHCPLAAMTFPVAQKGYWISSDGLLDRHDCAIAGHMPDACPGGNEQLLDDFSHCIRERQEDMHEECKAVLGSVCNDGYFGSGCTKCCKLNEECVHLQSKLNPATGQPYKTSWYFTESEGRCKECPEQDMLQMAVFGTVGSLFAADKLIKFAEVAKLSGALHAPLVSLLNFFQLCDLFKGMNLHWPGPLVYFVERFLSIFNFNIHMFHVHPECQLSLTYAEKWVLKMLSPILLVGLLFAQYMIRYLMYLLASGSARLWFGQHGCSRLCFHDKHGGVEDRYDEHAETFRNPTSASQSGSSSTSTFEVERQTTGDFSVLGLENRIQGGGGMQTQEADPWADLFGPTTSAGSSAGLLGPTTSAGPAGPSGNTVEQQLQQQVGGQSEPEPEPEVWTGPSATLQDETAAKKSLQPAGVDPMAELVVAHNRAPMDRGGGGRSSGGSDVSSMLGSSMTSNLSAASGSGSPLKDVKSRTHAVTFQDDPNVNKVHREPATKFCSLFFVATSIIGFMIVWVFLGEDMGPIEPSPYVYPESRQEKTKDVFPLAHGFAEACFALVTFCVARKAHIWLGGTHKTHEDREARLAIANTIEDNRLPRSLAAFGLSFSYQLRKGKIGIYVQTVNADAADGDEMAEIMAGQRVTHILDGDGSDLTKRAHIYTEESLRYKATQDDWNSVPKVTEQSYPGVQATNNNWTPSRIHDSLEQTMEILGDEANGIVRIKRPFTIRLDKRKRKDASLSWMFSCLNPARCVVQLLVLTGLVFVTAVSIGLVSRLDTLLGLIGLAVAAAIFLCDFIMFIKEWRSHDTQDATGDVNAAEKKPRCSKTRWTRKIPGLTSLLLFIVGSCFAWQTPFNTAAIHREVQTQLFDSGSAAGTIFTGLGMDGGDKVLYQTGMLMLILLALRSISGDKLRVYWDEMASFNASTKIDEVKFVAMEFLLIGYVMLVSAATQPMACHTDLDSKIKMSADNSIECDFCQPNAGIAVLGTAHTYAWLWKCSLLCTVLYSAGLPIFFFNIIWKYAATEELHTKHYLEHFGFLTSKFRDRWYFWEIFVLLRKMLHASISTHSAHRPVRQALLNLIVVFVSISSQCYCLPFVNNDANVAEFLTLASTFFTLLIGLGQGSDIDKGLAESEGHELAQQAYWLILAFLCGVFVLWTLGIVFVRLNSLMYDLNSGSKIEDNQFLEENMRKVLHKSKIESAILWTTKTRELGKQAYSDDPVKRRQRLEAKEALKRVRDVFKEINEFRDRVSWNDSAEGPNGRGSGNVTRWDRRRLDRYFRDIDRSTVYMYLSNSAELDDTEAEVYKNTRDENPEQEYPLQRRKFTSSLPLLVIP